MDIPGVRGAVSVMLAYHRSFPHLFSLRSPSRHVAILSLSRGFCTFTSIEFAVISIRVLNVTQRLAKSSSSFHRVMHLRGDNVVIFFLYLLTTVHGQTLIKFLFVIESTDLSVKGPLNQALASAEKEFGGGVTRVDATVIEVDRDDIDGSYENACAALLSGVTIILDMTWSGWDILKYVSAKNAIVYRRADATIIPYVDAINDLLIMKNATDVALIYENERDLNKSLYYLIGNSIIRLVVIDELSDGTVSMIRAMRPSPSYYAIFANTANMERLFKTAFGGGLVKRSGIWNLVFLDNNYRNFKYIAGDDELNVTLNIFTMNNDVCCQLLGELPCVCPPDFEIYPNYIKRLIGILVETVTLVIKSGVSLGVKSANCVADKDIVDSSNRTIEAFDATLLDTISARNDVFEYQRDRWVPTEYRAISCRAEIDIHTLENGNLEKLGNWTNTGKIVVEPGKKILPAKRYFRVGTTEAIPWASIKRDPVTGQPIKDAEGNDIWEGYCIDFIARLADDLNFQYDLVIPADMSFGDKLPNGKWTGLVGDLARGIDVEESSAACRGNDST